MHLPKIIAHRGAKQLAPENTLMAFEKAHALGATWVEFDVMIMQCGTLIVHHDDTFLRILGLDQNVHETSYAQIKDLDAGSWFKPEFVDVRIPTFRQTLACCARLGLAMNIELKTTTAYAEQTALATLAQLREFAQFNPENVLISSLEILALQTFHQHAPEYLLGLVADNWPAIDHAQTTATPLYSLNLHYPMLNADTMKTIRAQSYEVLAFTVNSKELAEQLFALGVCSVFSDDPLLLK